MKESEAWASEKHRLDALREYDILDSEPEEQFDALANLAAYLCKTHMACITFIEEDRQWIKARIGVDTTETTRERSFCQYTILNDHLLEIQDTFEDHRVAEHPDVTVENGIRFYAGAPLITPDGHRIGSICVMDKVPRRLDDQQKKALGTLANEVVDKLEIRKNNRELKRLLRKSQTFQDLFNNSGDICCILNSQGEIEFVNNCVWDNLGYTVSESLGKNIWHFCPPGERDRIIQGIYEKLEHGETSFCVETEVLTKAGDLKWFSWSNVFKDGKWLLNGRDITRQKQAQEELQQLSAVASSIDNGVVINDADNRIIWVNDAFTSLLGYSLEDVKGKQLGDVIRGAQTDLAVMESARKRNRNRESFSIDLLSYDKKGRSLWLSIMNSVVLDKEGEVVKTVEIITDVTERKTSELQLKTLSVAVEKSTAGVMIRDAANHILWMNPAFEQQTGFTLNELKGKVISTMLVGPETDEETLKAAQKALENKKPYSVEIQLYKKDRSPIWLLLSNTPIYNTLNKLERQVCVAFDITARKVVEQQLIKTREDAVQLSKAKESFLSVMSHEIRTPLNAVIGISRILLEDRPMDYQLENLDILKFSAENLLSLINDVLDFTKIETGNLELEKLPVELSNLARHTIESLKFKADEKKLQLVCNVDPQIPPVIEADGTRLYQILMNLLGNAMKFTAEGEIKLELKLETETVETARVKFEVTDSGIGIPADKIDSIFEAYQQAGTDTSRKYGGTGLGLTITKKLVELFGSQIFVRSEVNKGTTFYFSIQFRKLVQTADAAKQAAKADGKSVSGSVLVVDDNAINLLIAKKVLSKWPITVDTAENGLQALEKIGQNEYDLVLMDIHMPVMDGIEAVKKIRENKSEKYQKLPVIALTASVMKQEEEGLLKMGMNGFVLKPFNPDNLMNTMLPFLKVE